LCGGLAGVDEGGAELEEGADRQMRNRLRVESSTECQSRSPVERATVAPPGDLVQTCMKWQWLQLDEPWSRRAIRRRFRPTWKWTIPGGVGTFMGSGRDREVVVQVLGGFGVRRGLKRLQLRPSTRTLIALLAIEGAIARGDAAVRLYEDSRVERAYANLRTIMWRLREDDNGLVVEEGDGLRIDADLVDYQEALGWSMSMVRREVPPTAPPPFIGRRLLPGWSEPWLIAPREYLHLLQLHALDAAAERLLAAGRFGEASVSALLAVTMDALRESSNRLLIEALIREGNIAEGLRRYKAYERILANEMNAKPGAAVQSLVAPLIAAGYVAPHAMPTTYR
jgi:DNA-binding SARP family transcriptional activator